MHAPSITSPTVVKATSGQKLACRLRCATAEQRAALAVDLMAGRVAIEKFTARQAAMTSARPHHIQKQRKNATSGSPIVRDPTDAVDRLIDRIAALGGLDRLLQRLDEITRPTRCRARMRGASSWEICHDPPVFSGLCRRIR